MTPEVGNLSGPPDRLRCVWTLGSVGIYPDQSDISIVFELFAIRTEIPVGDGLSFQYRFKALMKQYPSGVFVAANRAHGHFHRDV